MVLLGVTGVTSRWPRHWACQWEELQLVPLALARQRPPKTWAAVWENTLSSSTAPTRWTSEDLAASTKVMSYNGWISNGWTDCYRCTLIGEEMDVGWIRWRWISVFPMGHSILHLFVLKRGPFTHSFPNNLKMLWPFWASLWENSSFSHTFSTSDVSCSFENVVSILCFSVWRQTSFTSLHSFMCLTLWKPLKNKVRLCRAGPVWIMGLLWRVQSNWAARLVGCCAANCHCACRQEGAQEAVCLHWWRRCRLEHGVWHLLDHGEGCFPSLACSNIDSWVMLRWAETLCVCMCVCVRACVCVCVCMYVCVCMRQYKLYFTTPFLFHNKSLRLSCKFSNYSIHTSLSFTHSCMSLFLPKLLILYTSSPALLKIYTTSTQRQA